MTTKCIKKTLKTIKQTPMKTIKFRAWHNTEKSMLEWNILNQIVGNYYEHLLND